MRTHKSELKITHIVRKRTLRIEARELTATFPPRALALKPRLKLKPSSSRALIGALPLPPLAGLSHVTTAAAIQHENAYVDYRRVLTPEGGVLFVYKDLDLRLRHTIWRLCAWSASMAGAWAVIAQAPVHNRWITLAALLSTAVISWLIVRKPVEVLRSIEIRPDCMILEGTDVFWLDMMEGGPPTLQEDDDGNQVLGGIYGTRFVEYATVRPFDDEDRTPQVFAAHLQEAMTQLWGKSLILGTVRKGSRQ